MNIDGFFGGFLWIFMDFSDISGILWGFLELTKEFVRILLDFHGFVVGFLKDDGDN